MVLQTLARTSLWGSRSQLIFYHAGWTRKQSTESAAKVLPLVKLQRAILPHLHPHTPHISLDIPNDESQLWAIVGPSTSSGQGSKAVNALTSVLAGLARPKQSIEADSIAGLLTRIHPCVHPFAGDESVQHVGIAAFAKKLDAGGSNDFQDFSTRYGALRDEDHITLFEQIMFDQGFEVGRIARLRIVPDRLTDEEADTAVREAAISTKQHIERIAPLLDLHLPGPASSEGGKGVALLHQPLISLSNGQTRRAGICGALVSLARRSGNVGADTSLLVLVQPFSGLDEPTRKSLATLLSQLHSKASPRVLLALRRQDDVPEGVTHIIDIDAKGRFWTGPRSSWHGQGGGRTRGVEGIRQNNVDGLGLGQGSQIAMLSNVSVKHGDVTILDEVSLTLRQGSRMIVKGENGSGKTTLLALLSGAHPQSYSFDDASYTLFGRSRSDPKNASRLLRRRIGYFGPDLLTAFPRRGVESGGLTVKQAIASGFEGVFSRTDITSAQQTRVEQLTQHFVECLGFRDDRLNTRSTADVLKRPFISLDAASQAVVLFLRAVVNLPDLLILDEPFQGMDADQVRQINSYLDAPLRHDGLSPFERVQDVTDKRRKQCVVLVSHYANEWPDTMGEYLMLDAGRVVDRI